MSKLRSRASGRGWDPRWRWIVALFRLHRRGK